MPQQVHWTTVAVVSAMAVAIVLILIFAPNEWTNLPYEVRRPGP